MTREEAIANLKMIRVAYIEPITIEQIWLIDETFEMAIKALSAEPCEDCISRTETIDYLKKVTVTDGITFETGFRQILYDIEQMPSVQPISKFVIEDIKADIAEFMAKIPTLGNCKEGWHNAGQRIGLEQACEIIDNHIAESEE